MRTFLSVLISYIVLCVVGIIICSGLFMVYIGCMNFVVGQPLDLFSFNALKTGLDLSVPLVVVFIPMFLILSLIKHSRRNRIIGIITTFLLSAASWGVGIPAYLKYLKSDTGTIQMDKKKLSAGYFRFSENNIYYFTNVTASKKADGIIIDVTKTQTEDKEFSIISNQQITIPGSEDFSDILVKRSIEIPDMLRYLLADLYYIGVGAKNSLSRSWLSWGFFCLFGLALFFVFTLSRGSKWRMINAFGVLLGTGVVLKLNAVCYGITAYKQFFPFLPSLNQKLKSAGWIFSQMESPLSVVVNLSLILIFIIIGIIALLVGGSKKTAEDGGKE